jgi:uncharacterized protein YciI
MDIRYGVRLMLIAGVVAGGAGLRATAQAPAHDNRTGDFYVKLTTVPLDTPEEVAKLKRNVVPSAVYWDDLYNEGKVAVLGLAQEGATKFSVVILEGVSEAEAHTIAEQAPSVKAGLTMAEVFPMQVYLESAPRTRAAQKSAR